jgi:hypothetical protein
LATPHGLDPTAWAAAQPLPLIGPWIAKLGYITDIFAASCAPTPQIWVEGAFAAAPKVIASIFKPFILPDILQSIKGRKHGSGKKLRLGDLRGAATIFRDGVKLNATFEGLLKNPGFYAFDIAAEFALKAEWYFLVVDITEDGLIEWISQAYKYAGCADPNNSWAQGNFFQGELTLPGTGLYYMDQIKWQHDALSGAAGPTVVMPPRQSTHATIAGTWGPNPALPNIPACEGYFVIYDNLTGKTTGGPGSTIYKNGKWTSSVGKNLRDQAEQPRAVQFLFQKTSRGSCFIESGYAMVNADNNGEGNVKPDP